MKCDHDECEAAPRYTLRAKTAPGQWQMLDHPCEDHLKQVTAAAHEQHPDLAGSIQIIPFAKRDWPPAEERSN